MRKLAFFLLLAGSSLSAQRLPVLKQIDLPHSYYYREMYLPQLTTGPSSVAWLPNRNAKSATLIYSMQGSLWCQEISSSTTQQLTDGPGYDYQPTVSSDGRWVVFAKYNDDAVELWALDLKSGAVKALTTNHAVNVEPHFSPDGTRVAFVSTQYNGHFHIFIGDFDPQNGIFKTIRRLTGETRSQLPRYYYSAFDHEISPTWSPDGKEIIYISNRGHIHGTGGFWRMSTEAPAAASSFVPRGPFARMAPQPSADPGREIHYEETNWRARPDWSPDGKRVVYTSYVGRSWHQLWIMRDTGGDVFPLTYGEYDKTNPRWSPDSSEIAYISNRSGNTEIWIQNARSADSQKLEIKTLKYLHQRGTLDLKITDATGRPASARVFITAADGRAFAPRDAWIAADDSFDRKDRKFEAHYFDASGTASLHVPAGKVCVEAMQGFENGFFHRDIDVAPGSLTSVSIRLARSGFKDSAGANWVSGDVHVHMNYGGTYRATPHTLLAQMRAENLHVVQNLIVNKEQRFPDIEYAGRMGRLDPASLPDFQLLHGQEFHTSYWGHLGLLDTRHLIIPGYAGYPNTAAASISPTNADVADMGHAQGGVVGYVHPFDEFPDPEKDAAITDELPVDVALGKVDYYEVVGFADHKASAAVWYKLLNLGFRIPAAAGTDAMTNFASLRGPVGLNRVYVELPAGRTWSMQQWLAGVKAGHTFTTNGPLLRFTLGRKQIGDELKLAQPGTVPFTASLRSFVPLDHLEVVCNGKVQVSIPLSGDRRSADAKGGVHLPTSGWCVLRAWAEKAEYPILDIYPYASTSPVYVNVAGKPFDSPEDAKYFLSWIDRLIANAEKFTDYNSAAEKESVLKELQDARSIYAKRAAP